jgi:DNA-binding MarR family transcriptional regulator
MTEADALAWRYFLLLLAQNYARTLRVVYALKQEDPLRRVAATLLLLIDDNLQGEMEARASQSDIAEIANLGRSKVNASLKALEGRGMIRRRTRQRCELYSPQPSPRTRRQTPRFAWRGSFPSVALLSRNLPLYMRRPF